MTLRKELEQMADRARKHGSRKLVGDARVNLADELVSLADKYGVDPHEVAFLWDAACTGNLHRVQGPGLDEEVP